MANTLPPENVWDYPRPAVCEPFHGELVVRHAGIVLAETEHAFRVLETSHPPCYYFPPGTLLDVALKPNNFRTYCEWKGEASYFDLHLGTQVIPRAAWTYRNPTEAFAPIKDHISFYASKVDGCFVAGERVLPQRGGFYGGWITRNLKGPFKGVVGSAHW